MDKQKQKIMITVTKQDVTEAFTSTTARMIKDMFDNDVFEGLSDRELATAVESLMMATGVMHSMLIQELFEEK